MNILTILKMLVLAFSFIMFCYQLRIATVNLMEPPTVDSTYDREIIQDDFPLITICPTNQANEANLKDLNYTSVEQLLKGGNKFNKTSYFRSWGAHLNLTFDDLLKQVFKLEKVRSVSINNSYTEGNLVFIPRYGICKETSQLHIKKEISLLSRDEARILITDKNSRSYFMPNILSHVGNKLFIKRGKSSYVSVQIYEKLHCRVDEKPMTERELC